MARTTKKKPALTPEEKLEQALVPEAEQPYKVPENWCWVYLRGIINEIKNGTTIKQDKSGVGYHVTRIESLQNQTIDFGRLGSIVDETAIKESDWYVNGDIALSHINSAEHVGKTALITESMLPLVHGMNLLRLRFEDSLTPLLFQYYSQSIQYKEAILARINMAVNQVSINQKQIGSLEFPLPPLPEQHRIVTRIESLFAKMDEAKEKAQAVVDGFEDRKAAILHKAFTGELTEGWRKDDSRDIPDWIPKTVGEIADVKGGKRVPKGMVLTDVNTGHPYLKAGNLKQGTVIDNDISYVPDDVLPFIKNYTVSSGDVYITNVGACIGDCGVIPPKYDGANLTENAVKLTNLRCVSEYLAWYLSSNNVQRLIKSLVASATLGKLSIANIKKIPVLLPSEEEQVKIIYIIKQLLDQEQHAKEIAERVIGIIDTMKKSILARAFRGELGTNDPEEESAVELVKRVF